LKIKILAVAAAALIGAGVYMHGGEKPRCLLQLFSSKKTEVKAAPQLAALTSNASDPKENKKKHQHKNHDAKGHVK
jgi:hypothetical protein